GHLRPAEPHPEPLGLSLSQPMQPEGRHAAREAEVVLVALAVAPPPVPRVEDDGAPAEPPHVDGRGEAGRTGPDDEAFPTPPAVHRRARHLSIIRSARAACDMLKFFRNRDQGTP